MPTHQQLISQDKLAIYLRTPHTIPHELQTNQTLTKLIQSSLPNNYNFELIKTIWRIIVLDARSVALQMPEGLLIYSCIICDILEQLTGVECTILGDVVYGACCVDDITAKSLHIDLLIHYGHSCLISNDDVLCNVLYIFVTIDIDIQHLIDTIKYNFTMQSTDDHPAMNQYDITLGSTIQFTNSIHRAVPQLKQFYGADNIHIPQCTPLSSGETLGCTSSKLNIPIQRNIIQIVIFVADGRFHLESLMINNPHIQHFYKYDPYNKKLTLEQYLHNDMYGLRQHAVDLAKQAIQLHINNKHQQQQKCIVGIILGTLGRQGSTHLLSHIQQLCTQHNIPHIIILLSEINPDKLLLLSDISFYIQIACPRLSIDWGHAFNKPLLNTYEAELLFTQSDNTTIQSTSVYPMDYYSKKGGQWTNYTAKQNNNKYMMKHKKPITIEYEHDNTIQVQ